LGRTGLRLVVWLGFEIGIAPVLDLSQAKRHRSVARLALRRLPALRPPRAIGDAQPPEASRRHGSAAFVAEESVPRGGGRFRSPRSERRRTAGSRQALGSTCNRGNPVTPGPPHGPPGSRSSRHENASRRVRPGPGLRSGDPGQGPSLGERRQVGRFWRWASSPGLSLGRLCDVPGLSGRARIGLCRFSAGSPTRVSTTIVWR
jgi:hypothetical protein